MASLFERAYQCVRLEEVAAKLEFGQATVRAWQQGELELASRWPPQAIERPGYPAVLRLVPPLEVPRRRLGTVAGQVALLHALAHIEFSAINLAWDAVYRFRDLPRAFYDDWVRVAAEEMVHFGWLEGALRELGCQYGELPVHGGLWEMAVSTAHDVLVRMALVPRVLEARGLDATPSILAKLQALGAGRWVAILQVILRDEIGHVAVGSRWFSYVCGERGVIPEVTFLRLVGEYFPGRLKGPLNREARLAAGFSEAELVGLERLGEVS